MTTPSSCHGTSKPITGLNTNVYLMYSQSHSLGITPCIGWAVVQNESDVQNIQIIETRFSCRQCFCFQKLMFFGYTFLYIFYVLVETCIFGDELTDVWAITKTLVAGQQLNMRRIVRYVSRCIESYPQSVAAESLWCSVRHTTS